MLTVSFIRENRNLVINRLKIKNFSDEEIINQVIQADDDRKSNQSKINTKQAELNEKSRLIGQYHKSAQQKLAEKTKQLTVKLKEEIKELNQKQNEIISSLQDWLTQIPNIPHTSVLPGKGEGDNTEIRSGGKIPSLDQNALSHWELIKEYDIIDFEAGIQLTGAGFPVYKGKGAKLQRALVNFFLNENINAGYQEYLPPLIVNEDSAFGTGQLPDKEGQMYHIPSDNFYLIPTSEVPITNLFRNVILKASDLPIKCTSYTPCFRREAGSWGKEVRGLNRLHQFDKVEIVQIQHPDRSYETLEEMVSHIESLVQKLELPYRIMRLCGGDMGFTSALTYDLEVYSAAQDKWLEISSVSNFESFQANRLKLRIKEEGKKKTRLAHTLNGSALALPRIVAALLENNQTQAGIRIPKALHSYTGFETIES